MTEIKAVFWDFGGVITTSPFESFNRLEDELGVPRDWIRRINSRNPDSNAWARLERNDIDAKAFDREFQRESGEMGHAVPGRRVLEVLSGDVRPQMVQALERIRGRLTQGCLTNNIVADGDAAEVNPDSREGRTRHAFSLFDFVLESSAVGVRKPEERFYRLALERAGIADPTQVVFLDDLGINLKPARALGMHTIKVQVGENAAEKALAELQQLTGLELI